MQSCQMGQCPQRWTQASHFPCGGKAEKKTERWKYIGLAIITYSVSMYGAGLEGEFCLFFVVFIISIIYSMKIALIIDSIDKKDTGKV